MLSRFVTILIIWQIFKINQIDHHNGYPMILYRNFIRADRKIKLPLNGITDIVPCDYIKINVFPNDVEFDAQHKYRNLTEEEFSDLFAKTNGLTTCSKFDYDYLTYKYENWFNKLKLQCGHLPAYDLQSYTPQLKGYRITIAIGYDGKEDDFGGLVIDLHQLKLLTEYRHDLFNFIYDQTFCDYIGQSNSLKFSKQPYIEHYYTIAPHKFNITKTYSLMENDGTIRLESLILACLVNTTKELFKDTGDYGSLLYNLDKIEVV